MNVLITGTTGMVGKGVLLECLDSPLISSVVVINRHSIGLKHEKLKEIIHPDFNDLTPVKSQLENLDACYFCMGVSALGISKEAYRSITYNMTLHMAKTLKILNPDLCFCYVSGAGTSTAENRRQHWANIKGKTENELLATFNNCYLFRPGYIQPLKGIKSATPLYNGIYTVLGPFFPLIKKGFPNQVTTTESVGKAMINACRSGYKKQHLTNGDINYLATL
jgi:hypothetical protein